MDVVSVIGADLDKVSSSYFNLEPNGTNVVVNFTGNHRISSMFNDVVEIFAALSANEAYKSVDLYTIYPDDSDGVGMHTDLKAPGVDLTKTSIYPHWVSGGCNDAIGNWVGYLLGGTPAATNILGKRTSNLKDREIEITITLKDGYYNIDGSKTIKYYLTFLTP